MPKLLILWFLFLAASRVFEIVSLVRGAGLSRKGLDLGIVLTFVILWIVALLLCGLAAWRILHRAGSLWPAVTVSLVGLVRVFAMAWTLWALATGERSLVEDMNPAAGPMVFEFVSLVVAPAVVHLLVLIYVARHGVGSTPEADPAAEFD